MNMHKAVELSEISLPQFYLRACLNPRKSHSQEAPRIRYDPPMTNFNHYETDRLTQIRAEIAVLAARFIAEEGAEYGNAKRKAVKQLLGNQKIKGNILPDNEQIEQEVREYNAIFFADSQPARLQHLRRVALDLMTRLAHFNPFVTGAVLNGTAGEHSDIYLHLYTDNSKDVAIFLLNLDMEFEVSEQAGKRNETVESLNFFYREEAVHLLIYDFDDIRHTDKQQRASADTLAMLIAENQTES